MLLELNAKTGGIITLIVLIAGAVLFHQFGYGGGSDFLSMSQEFTTGAIFGISLALVLLILASPEGIEPIQRSVTALSVVLAAMLILYVVMINFL
ncbi:hypothetical protein ACFLQI_01215 [Candidatus Undinarchaeota archaeon]